MSFGIGVGDFLAVIQLASKIRKDFSGAPEQLQNIAAEVRSLAGILQDVDTYLAGHELSAAQEERLGEIEENCKQILGDIEKFVDSNSSLQTYKSGAKQRIKRVWQRTRWDPDDTRDLRQRLTSNLVALNAFAVSMTNDNVVKLVASERERQNHEILEWLTPLDYTAQHSHHLREHLIGTGQWLIESPKYQRWLHEKQQLLFLHGIPGAGKTVLSSMIIDSLQNQCQAEKNSAVCYFYCDYRLHKEQQLDKILLCLLRQLVDMAPIFPTSIRDLYDLRREYGKRPTLDDIKIAFSCVAKSFFMAYMIIDALDECQNTDDCQAELINILIDLHRSGCVNVAITSRPIPNIQSRFSSYESIEIHASNDDIARYIERNLQYLPKFVTNNLDLQQEIKSKVTSSVGGMFLLAKLYIDSMKGKRSTAQLRRMLDSLISGPNSYKKSYTKAMEGIQGQTQDQIDTATEVLMWIVHAQRPLTSTELLHALAVEIDAKEFDKDNIPDLDETISACCGLVTIEAESKVVRLVHYTAQEFFKSDDGCAWLSGAQLKLAQKCITYLSFDEFSSGICKDAFSFENRLKSYPFYEYSSRFWGVHAGLCGNSVLIRQFLHREQQSQASSQVQVIDDALSEPQWYFIEREASFMSPLSLIAHFGMQNMLDEFLDKDGVDVIDDRHRTPFSYAAANGQVSLVQMLLEKGANTELSDIDGCTPLQWAARNGHAAVLSVMLANGSNIDGDDGYEALTGAAVEGHNTVLETLFKYGANVQDSGTNGYSVLHFASMWGRESTVAYLISKGAHVNACSKRGQTPLMDAARFRHLSTTALLLKHDADVNVRNNEGKTALMMCCRSTVNTSIIKLLVDHGAEIAATDNNQHSALHYAALGRKLDHLQKYNLQGKTDNIRLLLDHGADLLGTTADGWIALTLASKMGHLQVVTLLMDTYCCRDIKIDFTAMLNARDEHGRNILHHAARQNDLELFRQLANLDLKSKLYDNHGKSILDYAINSGSEEMVLFVLENIPSECFVLDSDSTWSPLHWACRQGTLNMIKLLATRGYMTRTVKTTFPDTNWAPLDIAVFFENANLITSTGDELNSEFDWCDTIASGIVVQAAGDGNVVPVRANLLKPPTYSSNSRCMSCLVLLQSSFISCHNCGDNYCFMCAKDASSIRVNGHRACLSGGACEDTCTDERSFCHERICSRLDPK